jgi:hypothetical protein
MPFALANKLAEFSGDGNNASQRCGWTGNAYRATFGFFLAW